MLILQAVPKCGQQKHQEVTSAAVSGSIGWMVADDLHIFVKVVWV